MPSRVPTLFVMKTSILSLFLGLLITMSVSAQVIVPFTQVYRVQSDGFSAGQNGNRIGNNGGTSAADQDVFFVSFVLPDLGGQAVADADLDLGITDIASGYNADLYAVRLTDDTGDVTSSDPNPDHQTGANSLTWDNTAFAPTPASIKIQDNFLTPSSTTGLNGLNASGTSSLVSYLNTNYEVGGVVYFALAADATGVSPNFNSFTANGPTADQHRLTLTAVPEPSGVALLAVGAAATFFLFPRRRKSA